MLMSSARAMRDLGSFVRSFLSPCVHRPTCVNQQQAANAALALRCESLGAALVEAKGEARLLQERERGQRERDGERLRHEVRERERERARRAKGGEEGSCGGWDGERVGGSTVSGA